MQSAEFGHVSTAKIKSPIGHGKNIISACLQSVYSVGPIFAAKTALTH